MRKFRLTTQNKRTLLVCGCIILSIAAVAAISIGALSVDNRLREAQTAKAVPSPAPSPTPVSVAKGNEYFADAVFIGDSRTEGFMLYSGITEGTYYYHTGLMVDTVFTTPVVKTDSGEITIIQALQQQSFGKVYIMLGVNELGWPYDDVFIQKYGELVDAVKAAQPNATVYIQSILPVSHEKEQKAPTYNNEKIARFNGLIEQMCAEKGVHFLRVYQAVQAEDGSLPPEAGVDGVHLNQEYCAKWLEYLKQHTV